MPPSQETDFTPPGERRSGPLRFPDLTGDLAADARGYCAAGFAIFPIKAGAKRPPLRTGWQIEATADWNKWAWWWSGKPYANIGIHLGKSRLVGIDADSPEAREIWREMFPDLPPAPSVRTRRGWHWYFRQPEGVAVEHRILHRSEAGNADLELRTGDHYDIAPPSVADEFVYEPPFLEIVFPEWPRQYCQPKEKRALRRKAPPEREKSTREPARWPDARKLIRQAVEVERGVKRNRLARKVAFRLAREGLPAGVADGEVEYICATIERLHRAVEREGETFEDEVRRAVGWAYERVEVVREALAGTFVQALGKCYGPGVRGDGALAVHLSLIGLGIEQASVEVVASYGDLRVGVARNSDDSIYKALRRLEAMGLSERSVPRNEQGERVQSRANTYVLTANGASELKELADTHTPRSDAPLEVNDLNNEAHDPNKIDLILSVIASDAAFRHRPSLLTWALLYSASAPLSLDYIARIRGRSSLTAKRQLRDLRAYGLVIEDAEDRWSCPLRPEVVAQAVVASCSPWPPSRTAQRSYFAAMAADTGDSGRAALLRARIEAARAAFHDLGIDARAAKAAEVERIKSARQAREQDG